ncbi:MAG: glycoside hydrolase family 2, partial [Muribaculum intestinale]|nr:glycoside hydrolase family 2 [Muribaculum intestinale]
MNNHVLLFCVIALGLFSGQWASASDDIPFMTNVYGREYVLLNGKWSAFTDLYDQGRKMEVYKNRKPQSNEEFYEYSFDGAMRLNVPGDWNSQYPELKYYEGTMWYARHFDAPACNPFRSHEPGTSAIAGTGRTFLYFGAVSYRCRVYLNGELIVSHEGGFTPFQIEVTGMLKEKDNFLCLEVSNRRTPDAIPAMNFDWWNYGGITRDVLLLDLPERHVSDYTVRLAPGTSDIVEAEVVLSKPEGGVPVDVAIPSLKSKVTLTTDDDGRATGRFRAKGLKLWAPGAPVLYDVVVASPADTVTERIGFRTLGVDGTKILVNGRPEFMRSISFHEEIPQRRGRACTMQDAVQLVGEAEALGVNMIRTAHYPQNEHIVRLAEERGILLWEEIPVWQGISFTDSATLAKAQRMMTEMIIRDKNRCAVAFWSVANETRPSPERDRFVNALIDTVRALDSSRLVTAAFDNVGYDKESGTFTGTDKIPARLDVGPVNKNMGW